MHVIGLDIGGVNVKAADTDGRSTMQPFELWKSPDELPAVIAGVLEQFPAADALAVTMTGELADCFRTKAEGVGCILQAVQTVAGNKVVFVWQTGAEFVSPDVAREIPLLVAAANWHALATWVGRLAPQGPAVLIDVGSTTTDIIPLLDGVPIPQGLTDRERLQAGELIYSGVRRTPVCAVSHSVPLENGYCSLAAELFATMLDVYLVLGDIPEETHDLATANGRPATRAEARDRLARAVCCDRTEITDDEIEMLVKFLADVQRQRISGALERVLVRMGTGCQTVLTAGSGAFLANRIVQQHARLKDLEPISLEAMFDAQSSQAACAMAVARLAAERLPGLV